MHSEIVKSHTHLPLLHRGGLPLEFGVQQVRWSLVGVLRRICLGSGLGRVLKCGLQVLGQAGHGPARTVLLQYI
jgi:hypothetical protein